LNRAPLLWLAPADCHIMRAERDCVISNEDRRRLAVREIEIVIAVPDVVADDRPGRHFSIQHGWPEADCQAILARTHARRDVESHRAKHILGAADNLAVQPDGCEGIEALKLQDEPLISLLTTFAQGHRLYPDSFSGIEMTGQRAGCTGFCGRREFPLYLPGAIYKKPQSTIFRKI